MRGAFSVELVTKDGGDFVVAFGIGLVIVTDGDDSYWKACFESEALRYTGTYIPVAVEDVAEIVDNWLYVTGAVSVNRNLAVESGQRFKLGGSAFFIHGGCCGGPH